MFRYLSVQNALIIAADKGYEDVSKRLIELGADIYATTVRTL